MTAYRGRHAAAGLVCFDGVGRAARTARRALSVWAGGTLAAEWERITDPNSGYGDELSPEMLDALRRLHQMSRDITAATSGQFHPVTLESSLLRPGIVGAAEAVAARRTTVDLTQVEAPRVGLESIVPLIPAKADLRPLTDRALTPQRRRSDGPLHPAYAPGFFRGVPSC